MAVPAWFKVSWKIVQATVIVSAVTLAGCGGGGNGGGGGGNGGGGGGNGGGGGGEPQSKSTATGVLMDTSTVSGVEYTTPTQQGVTNRRGQFTYKKGEKVTFRVGDTKLGTVKGQAVVTPFDFANSGSTTPDSTTAAVTTQASDGGCGRQSVNVSKFLKTLDSDNNPANGLTITEAIRKELDIQVPVGELGCEKAADKLSAAVKEVTSEPVQVVKGVADQLSRARYLETLALDKTSSSGAQLNGNHELYKWLTGQKVAPNQPASERLSRSAQARAEIGIYKQQVAPMLDATEAEYSESALETGDGAKARDQLFDYAQTALDAASALKAAKNAASIDSTSKKVTKAEKTAALVKATKNNGVQAIKWGGANQQAQEAFSDSKVADLANQAIDFAIDTAAKGAKEAAKDLGKCSTGIGCLLVVADSVNSVGNLINNVEAIQSVNESTEKGQAVADAKQYLDVLYGKAAGDLEAARAQVAQATGIKEAGIKAYWGDTPENTIPCEGMDPKVAQAKRRLLEGMSLLLGSDARFNNGQNCQQVNVNFGENFGDWVLEIEPDAESFTVDSNVLFAGGDIYGLSVNQLRHVLLMLVNAKRVASNPHLDLAVKKVIEGIGRVDRLSNKLVAEPIGYGFINSQWSTSGGVEITDVSVGQDKYANCSDDSCTVAAEIAFKGVSTNRDEYTAATRAVIEWGDGTVGELVLLDTRCASNSRCKVIKPNRVYQVKKAYDGRGEYRISVSRGNAGAESEQFAVRADHFVNLEQYSSDTDGDGLPDAWEETHFGQIGVDSNRDPDGDGLTNLEEFYGKGTSKPDYDVGGGAIVAANPDEEREQTVNEAPIADAGEGKDTAVVGGARVSLDASASRNPDGPAPAFSWKQVAGPTVALEETSTSSPVFTAPDVSQQRTLEFEVTVEDADAPQPKQASDGVAVTVTPRNDAPTAQSMDRSVVAGESLEATLSASDPNGDALTYRLVSGPSIGSVQVDAGGAFTYTAPSQASGSTEWTYEVEDDRGASAFGKVVVNLVSAQIDVLAELARPRIRPGDTAKLQIEARDAAAPYTVSIDWDGSGAGAGTMQTTDFAVYEHTYSSAGTYQPTVEITDAKGRTYSETLSLTVASQVAGSTQWSAQANNLDTVGGPYGVDLQVNQRSYDGQSVDTYTTDAGLPAGDDVFVEHRLPLPAGQIDLTNGRKARITAVMQAGDRAYYDRELHVKTPKRKFQANFVDPTAKTEIEQRTGERLALFRVTDLVKESQRTITRDDNAQIDNFYRDAHPNDANKALSVAMELDGRSVSVQSFDSANGYQELYRYNGTNLGSALSEIGLTYLGEGTTVLALLEYDADGDGTYQKDERRILTQPDATVDWSNKADGSCSVKTAGEPDEEAPVLCSLGSLVDDTLRPGQQLEIPYTARDATGIEAVGLRYKGPDGHILFFADPSDSDAATSPFKYQVPADLVAGEYRLKAIGLMDLSDESNSRFYSRDGSHGVDYSGADFTLSRSDAPDTSAPVLTGLGKVRRDKLYPGGQVEITYSARDETGIEKVRFNYRHPEFGVNFDKKADGRVGRDIPDESHVIGEYELVRITLVDATSREERASYHRDGSVSGDDTTQKTHTLDFSTMDFTIQQQQTSSSVEQSIILNKKVHKQSWGTREGSQQRPSRW